MNGKRTERRGLGLSGTSYMGCSGLQWPSSDKTHCFVLTSNVGLRPSLLRFLPLILLLSSVPGLPYSHNSPRKRAARGTPCSDLSGGYYTHTLLCLCPVPLSPNFWPTFSPGELLLNLQCPAQGSSPCAMFIRSHLAQCTSRAPSGDFSALDNPIPTPSCISPPCSIGVLDF